MGDPSTMNSTLQRFSLFEVFKIRCRFIERVLERHGDEIREECALEVPKSLAGVFKKVIPEQRGQPNPGGMGAQSRRNPPWPKRGHQHPGGAVPGLRSRLLKPTSLPKREDHQAPAFCGGFSFQPSAMETPPGQKLPLGGAPVARVARRPGPNPHPETAGMRRNNHRDPDSQKQQEKTTGENEMKIRKLFSRVFKAGTNPTQGFIRNNPNNYSQHGRHAVVWHQGRTAHHPPQLRLPTQLRLHPRPGTDLQDALLERGT